MGDTNILIYAAALAIIRSARKHQNIIPLNHLPTLDFVLTSVLDKSSNKLEPELIENAEYL